LKREHKETGLGLVEIVIGMLILGLIAISLIPLLWQGIRYSSEQSAVATATRQLNAIVEELRENNPVTCASVTTAVAPQEFTDGAGRTITSSGTAVCPDPDPSTKTVTVTLTAVDASSKTLATVNAIVYVP